MEFEDDDVDVSVIALQTVKAEVLTGNNPLVAVVKESGLETSKAKVILEKFHNFFDLASEWELRAKQIVVTAENQEYEMGQAKAGRLLLKKKRLDIEHTRKELKEQALREGKAIDGIANVLKALIIPIESYLEKQEKFVENKRALEEEARRLEAERVAEEQRLEEERLDTIARERREACLPYRQFWKSENPYFRSMPEDGFVKALAGLKAKKVAYDKEQEAVRVENERLKKEAADREAKSAREKAEADKKLADERAAADRKLEAERAKARAEKDVADKKAADEKAKSDKKLADERQKAEADRKRLEAQLKNLIKCPKCGHEFERKSNGKEI